MSSEKEQIVKLQTEILELKKQLAESAEIIKGISVPIIPSIIPDTILVPITGKLSSERFDFIISKILEVSHSDEVSTVIVDFSAISEKEIWELDLFGSYIHNMTSAIRLMGIQILYVGFRPALTQLLITSGLTNFNEIQSFLTFRTALQYLMSQKGMEFEQQI
ncbi:STAS domain-containing protein [Metabacillus idriensis]|uniref:STAS domain-containing protein n=1 Tax=Metabacillus idriensis TaxID=324768 RepID=UPI003D29223A